jgi:death-on-curing protein
MISQEFVLRLHQLSIEKYGGSLGIRDEGYLQSAIERPFSTFGGEELYPNAFQKAAAILESILKNHPFVDGNKRTGLLACNAVLLQNGWELDAVSEAAYDFTIQVASSHMEFEDIVSWIEANATTI